MYSYVLNIYCIQSMYCIYIQDTFLCVALLVLEKHSVDQVGLKLRDWPAFAPTPMLRLKAGTTTAWLFFKNPSREVGAAHIILDV